MVVSALGMFNELVWPDIPGLDTSPARSSTPRAGTGTTTSRARRVGVIGSAASAVQFVPEIVKQAGQVHLFQRTANWVMPEAGRALHRGAARVLPRRIPRRSRAVARRDLPARRRRHDLLRSRGGWPRWRRRCLAAIEVVRDPALREKLRPQHPYGCKRPLLSNDYYPAFNRPNLELVTERDRAHHAGRGASPPTAGRGASTR